MESYFIEEIYKQVLRKAQFSMSGHEDVEKLMYDFFDGLSQKMFFGEMGIKPRFLMGGILRIDDLEEWRVKPFDTFYYKTFKEAHKDRLLSFYFSILQKAKYKSFSMVLSSMFCTDIDFRVKINNSTSKSSFCHYKPDERVFEVNVSQNIFNEVWLKIESKDYLKNRFSHIYEQIFGFKEQDFYLTNCGIDRKVSLKKEYLDDQKKYNEIRPLYEKLYYEVYNQSEVSHLFNALEPELKGYLKHDNYNVLIRYKDSKLQDRLFKRFMWGVLGLAWICYYYDCTIEYCMSIAKVDYNPNESKYILPTNTTIQYKRNLGGIIIGYDSKYELAIRDRVNLNLMSDRITSVVAADYMSRFTNNLKKKNRDLAHAFKIANTWSDNRNIPKQEYLNMINDKYEWNKMEKRIKEKMLEGINSNFQSNIAAISKQEVFDFLIRRRVFLYFKYKDSTNDSFINAQVATYNALQGKQTTRDTTPESFINSNFYTYLGIKKEEMSKEFYLPEEVDWLVSQKLII